jgi:hypothetical protein
MTAAEITVGDESSKEYENKSSEISAPKLLLFSQLYSTTSRTKDDEKLRNF